MTNFLMMGNAILPSGKAHIHNAYISFPLSMKISSTLARYKDC